ncbi:hypothetical protein ACN38_g12998 [Penicillium nordicum]|uniref:Uncharacterized protein n=1 Tax=Penicillium nordicum TaxID=229535 RepID=A0A0M8NNS9_9EURO|nr:hypothetical protein ACN38_g12998 [Penicillium nordicum]
MVIYATFLTSPHAHSVSSAEIHDPVRTILSTTLCPTPYVCKFVLHPSHAIPRIRMLTLEADLYHRFIFILVLLPLFTLLHLSPFVACFNFER